MLNYDRVVSLVAVPIVVVSVRGGGPKDVRVVGHDAAERTDARVEEGRAFVPPRERFSTFEQAP